MDQWSALEICYGMSPLALNGDPAPADDPELWRDVWDECRDEALAEWIRAAPCSRPTAYYMFEAPEKPRRKPGESKPAWLWRVGEISYEELETARRHTAETAACNAMLSPRDRIAPTEVDELVRDRGLLTEAEIDAMWSSPRRPAEVDEVVRDRGLVSAAAPGAAPVGHEPSPAISRLFRWALRRVGGVTLESDRFTCDRDSARRI